MRDHLSPTRTATILFTTLTFLAGASTLPTVAVAQSSTDDILVVGRRPVTNPFERVVINHAINIIGFDKVKADDSGRLEMTDKNIILVTDKSVGTIPVKAIDSISIEHSTKALLRGFKSTLASLAPNGAGQIYSAIRPGAETLTIFYTDENQAVHAAVVLLSAKSKDNVLRTFARIGIKPDASMTNEALAVADPRVTRSAMAPSRPMSGPQTVMVNVPRQQMLGLPTAFAAAIYEEMVQQTAASNVFDKVWRQGDVRAGRQTLTLALSVTEFKKGSAGVRGAIPVLGMVAGKTEQPPPGGPGR